MRVKNTFFVFAVFCVAAIFSAAPVFSVIFGNPLQQNTRFGRLVLRKAYKKYSF